MIEIDDELLDGSIYHAVQSIDFDVPPSRYRSALRRKAEANGIKVRTRYDPDDDNGIYFQFYLPGTEE